VSFSSCSTKRRNTKEAQRNKTIQKQLNELRIRSSEVLDR